MILGGKIVIKTIFGFILAFSGILLLWLSPDGLSLSMIGIMTLFVATGFIVGIMRNVDLAKAFSNGRTKIVLARDVETKHPWFVLRDEEYLFQHKKLDELYKEYIRQVHDVELEKITLPIESQISKKNLDLFTWDLLVSQIPGILTSLGILGTFIGLIIGVNELTFTNVEIVISSIETLLGGIRVAFYTSIAGVILSILFSIVYTVSSKLAYQSYQQFLMDFHTYVISSDDQLMKERTLQHYTTVETLLRKAHSNDKK